VFDESVFGAVGIVKRGARGTNGDLATAGHGIFGIDHEIHDDLLELAGIGARAADGWGEAGGELDIFTDERA
jgi:hypothetical protein